MWQIIFQALYGLVVMRGRGVAGVVNQHTVLHIARGFFVTGVEELFACGERQKKCRALYKIHKQKRLCLVGVVPVVCGVFGRCTEVFMIDVFPRSCRSGGDVLFHVTPHSCTERKSIVGNTTIMTTLS